MADAVRMQQAPRHAPWWVIACVLAALLVLGELGYMQHEYGQFRPWPSAAPPKLPFDGRDYKRTDDAPTSAIGWVGSPQAVVGHTRGGGEVWSTPNNPYAPTVLWVRAAGKYYTYTLKGGP